MLTVITIYTLYRDFVWGFWAFRTLWRNWKVFCSVNYSMLVREHGVVPKLPTLHWDSNLMPSLK